MKKPFFLIAVFFLMIIVAPFVSAKDWQPDGAIKIIVPWPPGGAVDVSARIFADGIKKQGMSAVIINTPGAGGNIGIMTFKKSNLDGLTVMLTSTSFMFNKILRIPGTETYDIDTDFRHVGLIGLSTFSIYARKDLHVSNLKDLLVAARQGHKFTMGTSNPGPEIIVTALIKNIGNDNITLVRYQGSAPAVTNLMGGHVDMVVDNDGSSLIHSALSSNKAKRLVRLEPKNSNSETLDEFMSGLILRGWFGLTLPQGTSDEIVKWHYDMLVRVMNDAEIQSRLKIAHIVPVVPESLSQFSKLIRDDFNRYTAISN